MGRYFKFLYTPWKIMSLLAGERSDWQRENGSLRHFARRIERTFRKKKLDVIFSTSSIPGTKVSSAIPVIFWTDATLHRLEAYYGLTFSERLRRIGHRQEESALKNASFACFASEWAAEGAREFAAPEHVAVIPFGANLKTDHTRDDVQRWITERRIARPRSCKLLLVGVNWNRKGTDIAIEAARAMNERGVETRLCVVGSTPPGPVPEFVEVAGFIDKTTPDGRRAMCDLYAQADIFILPSRAEAYGVVVTEAAAFGVPSLVCATGGLSETVREGITGFQLKPEEDGAAYARRAEEILSNYKLYAVNAYEDYERRLNWKVSVDRLVDLMRLAVMRSEPAQ